MDFGEALQKLKNGEKLTREEWGNKIVFVSLNAKGSINENINEIWEVNTEDVLEFDSFFQILLESGKNAVWIPNTKDILANDWKVAC